MLRNSTLVFLLLVSLAAPSQAQNFPGDAPATEFTIVDGATHKAVAEAEVQYACGTGGGSTYSGPDGTVALTLYGEKACDIDVRLKGYQELKKSWTLSDSRTLALLPADAAHPGWVDPGESATPGQEMPAFGPAAPQADSSWQAMLRGWLEALIAALLPAIAFFLLREISVRATLFLMMRKGGGGDAPAIETPSAPAGAPPPTPVRTIEIGTLNGLLLQGPSQARLERALDTHREKYKLVAQSLVPQLAGMIAAFYLAGAEASIFAPALLVALDLLFLVFLLSLYLQGKRLVEVAALIGLLPALAFAGAGRFSGIPIFLGLLPALLQGVYLAVGFHRLRRAARADGRKFLVVLRVFNADRNAAFLFGPLMAMWRFVGPYVTVSDPSYVRYQFTIFQRSNITKTLGTTLTIGLLVFLANHLPLLFSMAQIPLPAWLDGEQHQDRLKALVYAGVAIAAILPAILYLWRRFLKQPAQAVAQVDRATQTQLGIESDYRGGALFCFDDVWKPAVGRMLEVADVVLMDLRGFSAERQGCAYEIGQLIDRFRIDRLLLLVDAATPLDLLDTLIRERWAAMAADSPNRGASEPLIRFYETGDREKRDIRNIIGLLSMSLEGAVAVQPVG